MKNGVRAALGVLLSVMLLWWTMKDTSVHAVWDVLSKSSLPLWIACMVFATAIFPLRARRWQALLAPVAGRLPFRSLWEATAIGMMATNVIPFRAGEFARPFALSRAEPRVKFTAAFASVAVDRLFDATVVLLMMLLATLDPAFPSQQPIGDHTLAFYLKPTALFLGLVLAGLVLFVVAPDRVFAISDAIMRRVAPRFEPKVRGCSRDSSRDCTCCAVRSSSRKSFSGPSCIGFAMRSRSGWASRRCTSRRRSPRA